MGTTCCVNLKHLILGELEDICENHNFQVSLFLDVVSQLCSVWKHSHLNVEVKLLEFIAREVSSGLGEIVVLLLGIIISLRNEELSA